MRFFCFCGLPFGWFWQNLVVLSLKLFVWQAFWQEKKDSLLDDWTFLWWKNLKIPISLSLKVTAAYSFFLVSVCILCIFWPNFIALSLKTFFWQPFKGTPPSSKFTQESPWETRWSSCPGGWRTSSVGRGTPPSTSQSSSTPNGSFSGPKLLQ